MEKESKVVILCGGKGTRLHEETETKPKPMVQIGGTPILVHIMHRYYGYGYRNFVLCLGYKGDVIEKFFREVEQQHIMGLNLSVIRAETGLETMTGARIKRIEKYIDTDNFLATYGDAVSNVDISELVKYHEKKGKTATLTAVHLIQNGVL